MWMRFNYSPVSLFTTWLWYTDLVLTFNNDFGFVLRTQCSRSTTTLALYYGLRAHDLPLLRLEVRIAAPFAFDFQQYNTTMTDRRCANCGIDVSRIQRHSLESEDILAAIQRWVEPQQVSRENLVCHQCWVNASANLVAPQEEPERRVGHLNVCINCGCSLRRLRSHLLHTNTDRENLIRNVIAEWIQPRAVTPSSHICHPCWQRADRASVHFVQETASTSSASVSNAGHIYLPNYKRAANTESHCIFPECNEGERIHIPTAIRVRLFCDYSFYVPPNCCICNFHLRRNTWTHLINVENGNHTFTAEFIEDFAFLLKSRISNNIDFENINDSDDHLVYYWLGMSKHQFRQILLEVPRLNNSHRGATGLAAYLTKLRTGDSDQRLSTLFRVPRSTLERLMNTAREILNQDFVPQNLGLQHITREEIAQRNLVIPNGLFGSTNLTKPIVIMDGTYVYIQKSSNYWYQKQTYSLHKFRNLVKPFLIVCSDGYIVDVLGPYPATTSDAEILRNEFVENSPMRSFFQHGDVFILDRGFRDAIPFLTECGYSTQVPASLEEGETQLSTLQANHSRKVTICRWVVEVVNGVFKQAFKLFRQDFFNRASAHVMIDFAVAAALINRFHPRIMNREDADQILAIINEKMYTENNLADYVIQFNLNRRRSQFVNITVGSNNLNDFPQLTMSELILIACGTYQIKQARSYHGEHIRANGTYSIEICRDENSNLPGELLSNNCWLLRAKIQSRHISRKVYFVYIIINNNCSGRDAIQHYCCNCLVGKRTVGCCAHTMTVLWYIGWARHEANIIPPAPFLDEILVLYENE